LFARDWICWTANIVVELDVPVAPVVDQDYDETEYSIVPVIAVLANVGFVAPVAHADADAVVVAPVAYVILAIVAVVVVVHEVLDSVVPTNIRYIC